MDQREVVDVEGLSTHQHSTIFLCDKSPTTRESYLSDLKCLGDYLLNTKDVSTVANFLLSSSREDASRHIITYRGFLITNGYSPNTINRRLSTIRSFFKMAKMIGLVDYSIEVPNVKTKILRDTSGLKINEISKVFSNLKNLDSFKAARNYAIVRILFDLGFRATEVVTLDLCHLDLADKSVWVLGKGDTQRVKLSLPDQTCEALKEWIEARGDFEGPLFFALKADRTNLKRLTRQGLRDIVKSVAGEFGVPKKTTHSWRHSSITQAIVKTQENGLGLEVVLDHSRHSKNSIKLLMVYWDRLQNMQGKISSLVASQVFEYTDEDECA